MKNNYVNHLEKGYHQTNFHGIFGGSVAQTVEQRTENPCVGGSIPSRATIKRFNKLVTTNDKNLISATFSHNPFFAR